MNNILSDEIKDSIKAISAIVNKDLYKKNSEFKNQFLNILKEKGLKDLHTITNEILKK